jgi:hypothetical protein
VTALSDIGMGINYYMGSYARVFTDVNIRADNSIGADFYPF